MRAFTSVLIVVASVAAASAEATEATANPIRRVVNLLQGLSKKIKEEGEKEEKLHETFMCYCKKTKVEIAKKVSESSEKLPQLRSDLEEAQSQRRTLKMNLKTAREDQAAAADALKSAEPQRAAEHKEYVAEATEYKGFINSLKIATAALAKGLGASFLQAKGVGAMLQTAVESSLTLSDNEKNDVTGFLQGASGVPGTTDIVGMCKAMQEDYELNLRHAEEEEQTQLRNYRELVSAKTKQIKTLKAVIQEKKEKISDVSVTMANLRKDTAEVERALTADTKFEADLKTECTEKQAMVEKMAEARGQELIAVGDTIKILSDDNALEMFKKTLPGAHIDNHASLLQVDSFIENRRRQALAIVHAHRHGSKAASWGKSDLDLLELALKGGKADLSKVTKMIDEMVKLSKDGQASDDKKIEYCEKQIDVAEDRLKDFGRKLKMLTVTVAERKEFMSSVDEEVKTIVAEIKQLDKSVKKTTVQRKKENEEFVELVSGDKAAIELLGKAKDRLDSFYNPKAHKKTGFIVLPAWNGVRSNSFMQVSSRNQLPQRILNMLNTLVKDLDMEVFQAELEEKASQKDYEEMLEDTAARRSANTKALTEKEGIKAETEEEFIDTKRSLRSETAQKKDAVKFLKKLHGECDWLQANYKDREEARQQEVKNLKDAKAVLSGANYGK